MMDAAVSISSIKGYLLRLLGTLPADGSEPLTHDQMDKLYREPPPFTQYLPWKAFDAEDEVFEFADGASVGAAFELSPIDVDGRPDRILHKIEMGIQRALQNIPTYAAKPWIVQTYLQDEPITDLVDQIREYSTPAARETRHHQLWLDDMEEHCKHLRKPGGMFYDKESNFYWNGQRRRVRCVIYRRSDQSEWLKKNGRPIPGKGTPAEELNEVINSFIVSLSQTGINAHRYTGADLYQWLLPWFSPKPEGFESPHDFLKANPFPEDDECIGISGDLAEMVTLGCPESREDGTWLFTGVPHRLIPLQGIDTPAR